MSRYYKIVVSDPSSGQIVRPASLGGAISDATYTSYVNGKTLPGAWNVELDIQEIDAATPMGFNSVRVWGVSVAEIAQANDLVGKNIKVFGGMQAGLPLANPRQAGLLTSGVVYQAFGNWIGVDMTLDFVIMPCPATGGNTGGPGLLDQPRNFTLNWQNGQQLSSQLKQCLQTAFPGYTVNVNVTSSLVARSNESLVGAYTTLQQLAQAVRSASLAMVKTQGYAGVSIVPRGTTIDVFDGTVPQSSQAAQISFVDLIGQPTWIDSPNIQFKTAMRSDLKVGQQITLPPTVTTNSSISNSSLINQRLTFQGGFTIISLRSIGNYRQPTADAWVTVVEAAPNKVAAGGAGSASAFAVF